MTEPMRTPGKLGKLAPRHDPRTLKLRDYLPQALPPPPTSRTWDHGLRSWGMMANDRLGDCTCAAVGHAVQLATVNAATEVTIADSAIIAAYSAVSGYDPRTGANDNGAVELDVLRYWQQTGVGGHKAAAYADVDIRDLDDVRDCIDLFGYVYIGFYVPASAMQQFSAGQQWDVVANDGGIEGGHAVIIVDYDTTSFTCVTWGQLQRMTTAFWQKYVDEAHGVVTPEWIAANGQSPSGLGLQQLLTDVQELTQQPTPTPTPPTPAQTHLALSASPNPATAGQPLTVSCVVTAVGGAVPTGTVTLSFPDGSGAITLSNGAGSYSVTRSAGTFTISAAYSGDASCAPCSGSMNVTVNPAPGPDPVAQFWAQIGPYAFSIFAAKDVSRLALLGQLCSAWAAYLAADLFGTQPPGLPLLPEEVL